MCDASLIFSPLWIMFRMCDECIPIVIPVSVALFMDSDLSILQSAHNYLHDLFLPVHNLDTLAILYIPDCFECVLAFCIYCKLLLHALAQSKWKTWLQSLIYMGTPSSSLHRKVRFLCFPPQQCSDSPTSESQLSSLRAPDGVLGAQWLLWAAFSYQALFCHPWYVRQIKSDIMGNLYLGI